MMSMARSLRHALPGCRLRFHGCPPSFAGGAGGPEEIFDREDMEEESAERDLRMRARISRYFNRKPKVAASVPRKNKELEAINRFKQRARRAKELEHKRYQSMMNKVGAAVQRQSVEDTFAKAEQVYLSRTKVAEGAKALSVSQCLDALQESLNELRSRYANQQEGRPGQYHEMAAGRTLSEIREEEGAQQAHTLAGDPQRLETEGQPTRQARRPELFQTAETNRIKEIAGQWIQSAKALGNLRVEQEVRHALKGVYGVDIVEKVEDVRRFIDNLDSDQGKLARSTQEKQPKDKGFWWQEPEGTDDEEAQEGPLEDTDYEDDINFDDESTTVAEQDDEEGVYQGREEEDEELMPFLHVLCPMETIVQQLRSLDIIAEKTRLPKPVSSITNLPDSTIINWFRSKAYLILKQYRPANNLWEVRRLINFHIRWSLIYTLAKKHKSSASKIIKLYGKAPSVKIPTMVWKGQVVSETVADFPTVHQVNSIRRGFDRQTLTPWEFNDALLTRCKRDGAPERTIPAMCGSGISADKV